MGKVVRVRSKRNYSRKSKKLTRKSSRKSTKKKKSRKKRKSTKKKMKGGVDKVLKEAETKELLEFLERNKNVKKDDVLGKTKEFMEMFNKKTRKINNELLKTNSRYTIYEFLDENKVKVNLLVSYIYTTDYLYRFKYSNTLKKLYYDILKKNDDDKYLSMDVIAELIIKKKVPNFPEYDKTSFGIYITDRNPQPT